MTWKEVAGGKGSAIVRARGTELKVRIEGGGRRERPSTPRVGPGEKEGTCRKSTGERESGGRMERNRGKPVRVGRREGDKWKKAGLDLKGRIWREGMAWKEVAGRRDGRTWKQLGPDKLKGGTEGLNGMEPGDLRREQWLK